MTDELPQTWLRRKPVYARVVRRMAGLEMEPPTEEEQSDAIRVLKIGPLTTDPADDRLYAEAEMILHECG